MPQHLIPSDASIKAIKQGDERKRLLDGAGLYLKLFVNGGSHGWRLDYVLGQRRNTLSLGTYPKVGLSAARKKAAEAKKLISDGVDPSAERKAAKEVIAKQRAAEARVAAGLPAENSFEALGREWFGKNEPNWAPSHAEKIKSRLERDVYPWLGARPVKEIQPVELLNVLKRVEARGATETAHRVHQYFSQIFRFAVATSRAATDPSRDLRGALMPWRPESYPTLTDPREVGILLDELEHYQGGLVTKCALRLLPLLFVRPGELRQAEWSEFNPETAEWRIPAAKMKARALHIVPLSQQALTILNELRPLTGRSKWVFPGNRTNGEPMSENTINAALRRLGYDRTQLTAHGFRGMASTLLHEQGWNSEIIERQLSHAERNKVKAAYNRAEHLPARRKMMQDWADYLDSLRLAAAARLARSHT